MLITVIDFLVVVVACRLGERLQKKLDYTQQEVRVLEEVVRTLTGKERLPLSDAQR